MHHCSRHRTTHYPATSDIESLRRASFNKREVVGAVGITSRHIDAIPKHQGKHGLHENAATTEDVSCEFWIPRWPLHSRWRRMKSWCVWLESSQWQVVCGCRSRRAFLYKTTSCLSAEVGKYVFNYLPSFIFTNRVQCLMALWSSRSAHAHLEDSDPSRVYYKLADRL